MAKPNDDACPKPKAVEAMQEALTARIIQDLREGTPTWTKPWTVNGKRMPVSLPTNAISGRGFSGINILQLWAAQMEKGYSSPLWCTFKQAQDIGAKVRKGERSTTVIYVKFVDHKDDASKPEGKRRKMPFMRSHYSFNLDQLENVPVAYLRPQRMLPESEAHLECVRYVRDGGVTVQFGADKAAYYPAGDRVCMPHVDAFTDYKAFCGTLCHEAVHWTSHPDRLNRKLGQRFGDKQYALEECIAELGAAFMCAQLGIEPTTRTHASYIKSWITVLEEDFKVLTTLASMASAACQYVGTAVADTRLKRLEDDLQPVIAAE